MRNLRDRAGSCGVLLVCLLLACSDSDSSGAGGSGGGAVGGSGGGAAGGQSGGGSLAGAGGGSGNCADCIACVQTNCASQLSQCQNNTSCNAIFQCAMACTMRLEECIVANASGASTWGPGVAACANANCISNGCPY